MLRRCQIRPNGRISLALEDPQTPPPTGRQSQRNMATWIRDCITQGALFELYTFPKGFTTSLSEYDKSDNALRIKLMQPLTSVTLVRRTPPLSPLPCEIAACIDAFADPSGLWTLKSASDAEMVRLLDRLLTRIPADEIREAQYIRGVRSVTEMDNLSVLRWWMFSYPVHKK